ncbi:MAG: TerD family protein [Treponema sp.]|jgi:stress response protein SCP2|nr:TerD family protein [Treponema sp.]
MIVLQRGFKSKLADGRIDPAKPFSVEVGVQGNAMYEFSCFCLNAQEKNVDDAYYIFYNQMESPNGSVTMDGNANPASYSVDLGSLPSWVQTLHFTANIDGNGNMGQIRSCTARIRQNNKVAFELKLSGSDFSKQKALIVLQIYKKGEWRVGAIAAGFDGGLAQLCKNYGIDLSDDSEQERRQSPELTVTQAESPPVQRSASRAEAATRTEKPVETEKDDDDFERSDNDWV